MLLKYFLNVFYCLNACFDSDNLLSISIFFSFCIFYKNLVAESICKCSDKSSHFNFFDVMKMMMMSIHLVSGVQFFGVLGSILSTCLHVAFTRANPLAMGARRLFLALNFYFTNKNNAQLYQYTQLETMPNFLGFML